MSDEYEDVEQFPSDDDLLETFWEESYPGWSGGFYALEPKEVYTDHGNGIRAVREQLEPHLRRKHRQELLDELIADITDRAGTANIHMYSDVDETGQFITESLYFDDWIKEYKEAE